MKTSKRKSESGAAGAARVPVDKAAAVKASAGATAAQKTVQKPTKAKSAPSVALASHCSVKDAAALKVTLCHSVGENGPVTIDVRSLERVDTATVQLLCAFVRDRATRAQNTAWLGKSAALDEAARLLGVNALLDLPAAQNSGAAG